MKILIVEDDHASRELIRRYLDPFGQCDVVVNGVEAVEAVRESLDEQQPYDLICLDIMLPKMTGQEALEEIRTMEDEHGIMGLNRAKVIMTTALGDVENIMKAFRNQCEGYVTKPINKVQLLEKLKELELI